MQEYGIGPPSSEGELQEKQKVFFENFNQIQKQNNLYDQGMSSWKLKVHEKRGVASGLPQTRNFEIYENL